MGEDGTGVGAGPQGARNDGAPGRPGRDLPPVSASSDMIRRNRVLLSHTLDAARSY